MKRKSVLFSSVLACVGSMLVAEAALARPTVVDPVDGASVTLCPHYGATCRARWEEAIRVGLTNLSSAIQAEGISEEDLMMAVEAAAMAGIVSASGLSEGMSEEAMMDAVRQIAEAEQAAADETLRLFRAAYSPGARVSHRAVWEAAVSEAQGMTGAEGPVPSNLDVWGMGMHAAGEAHAAAMAEAEETGEAVAPPSITGVWRMGLVAMQAAHVQALADAMEKAKAAMMDESEEMAEEMAEMSSPSDLDVWRIGLVALVNSVIASESSMAN